MMYMHKAEVVLLICILAVILIGSIYLYTYQTVKVTFKVENKAKKPAILTFYNALKAKGGGHYYPSMLITDGGSYEFEFSRGQQVNATIFLLAQPKDLIRAEVEDDQTAEVVIHYSLTLYKTYNFTAENDQVVEITIE